MGLAIVLCIVGYIPRDLGKSTFHQNYRLEKFSQTEKKSQLNIRKERKMKITLIK